MIKSILLLLLVAPTASAFSVDRRAFLVAAMAAPSVAQAAPYCASGVGDACDELSEGNELIRSLQEKSAANREKNMRQARDAYYQKNYPDWFASIGKVMLQKSDGTYVTVSDQEFEKLKKSNKIGYERPMTMGGRTVDLTQPVILLLKD